MRRLTRILAVFAALTTITCGAVIYWRRNPRLGTTFVNSVVNPGLLRRGLAGGAKSEIGTIEHVGRRSGVRRMTPVHPEPTADGFRIIVPLGAHSEWARNVLAAGHCRLQLHGLVYDLDEPTIVRPSEVDDLPALIRLAETVGSGTAANVRRKSGALSAGRTRGRASNPPEAGQVEVVHQRGAEPRGGG
jgi:hypothetical protein